MKREDITNFRIKQLVEKHETYEFPEFIAAIRNQHGLKRRSAAEDMGIPETRLLYLEHGRFKRKLPVEELKLIGNYYGIDYNLLKIKAERFLREAKKKVGLQMQVQMA